MEFSADEKGESVGQADKSILVAVTFTDKDASHTLKVHYFGG